MSLDEQLQKVELELTEARANLTSHLAQKTANEIRTADWIDKVKRMGPAADSDAALASCASDKVTIENQIAFDQKSIAELEARRTALMEDIDEQNSALASAASKGLTGEVALQKAQTETIAILIGAGLVAIVVGFWAWRKFIRKK